MKPTKLILILIVSTVLSVVSYGQSTVLIPGNTIERKMLKGENHHYTISLKKGDYVEFVLKQISCIIDVDIKDPSGGEIKTPERKQVNANLVTISFESIRAGKYSLHFYPWKIDSPEFTDSQKSLWYNGNQGDYTITEIVKLSAREYKPKLAKIQEDKNAFQQWINNNAHELKTVDAGNGFEDLEPFKAILKDVRVVGLGEATHGTSEFFRMKHRMLEFLVKEMDFTSFYIEASMSRCRYINDYVLYGRGDIDTATAIQGFWIWRVEEVKNMIEWMRQYNTTVPEERKVKFFGIDLQINDRGWEGLKDFYTKVNPQKLIDLDSLQIQAEKGTKLVYNVLSDKRNEGSALLKDALPKALAVMNDLVLNEGKYKFLTTEKEYDENLMNIKLIIEEIYKNTANVGMLRDYYMAENILNLLSQEKPNTNVVVWAHNGHIGKKEGFMGYNLAQVLGNAYYAIGFEFYSGSFQAKTYDMSLSVKEMNIGIKSVGAPPVESMPWYFNQTGKEKLFIDFQNTGTDKIKNFSLPYEMHSIAATFSSSRRSVYQILLTNYDGMIYIQETTGAKGLPEMIFK